MENNIYNKKVSFIDAANAVHSVDITISLENRTKRRYDTLKKIDSYKSLSMTGNSPCCSGQIYNYIKPRTEGQRLLVDFWKKYHLNDCVPGTKKQMDYLKGGQFDEDYKKVFTCVHEILDTHGITKKQLSQFDKYGEFCGGEFLTLENRLIRLFGGSIYHERYFLNELGNARSGLHKVGIHQYLIFDVLTTPSMKNDYSVMRAFLAGRGLLEDRGYIYGSELLYKPFDKDELIKIIDMVEQEEINRKADDLTDLKESYKNNKKTEGKNELEEEDEELPDLNTDSEELLELVMNENNCDETNAKRIIALMRAKDIGIENLWNIDVFDDTLISYGHITYYVADKVDLENIARDMLHDERELWVEAVKANNTDKGLEEWIDDVINYDGIGSILGHYDGYEHEEEVMNERFTIIRE